MRVHRFPAFVTPAHWSWPAFLAGLPTSDALLAESDLLFLIGVAGTDAGFPVGRPGTDEGADTAKGTGFD